MKAVTLKNIIKKSRLQTQLSCILSSQILKQVFMPCFIFRTIFNSVYNTAQSENTSNPKINTVRLTKLDRSMSNNFKWMHRASCLKSPSPDIIFIFQLCATSHLYLRKWDTFCWLLRLIFGSQALRTGKTRNRKSIIISQRTKVFFWLVKLFVRILKITGGGSVLKTHDLNLD